MKSQATASCSTASRGYVAKSADRARLVIGPFRGASDAEIFAEDLETVGVDAFSWTNSASRQDCATRHGMSLPPGVAAHPSALARPPPS